jgi:hypothetical protein
MREMRERERGGGGMREMREREDESERGSAKVGCGEGGALMRAMSSVT